MKWIQQEKEKNDSNNDSNVDRHDELKDFPNLAEHFFWII